MCTILPATGTVVLFAAIIARFVMGAGLGTQLKVYGRTLNQLKFASVTIAMIQAYITPWIIPSLGG